ncbi:uncharacterized protein MELLADRAFT_110070 [Melampsora larici-populina 98AG31]|uniref:Uncharacterized protein n=1 Tax=Melampsora larici-populina (strain 98AG31 / pathotype 3-4-7) TaxID=747676 RepID=F4RYK1_MELLP|nr:uncharacterized protein MELLADRAFT_110070 [Melampsora larici-populina 98AG31]EGG02563.1 hypothetical protein MELLADRAFT_110070 [Melampsora larici-populina 98AG31]
MFPPVLIDGLSPDNFLPQLRAMAFHDRVPISPLAQQNSPERTRKFNSFVGTLLDQGNFHFVPQNIDRHVEEYNFLNTDELGIITDATNVLIDNIHDITSTLCGSQHIIAYTQMLLKVRDPEVSVHRKLFKAQLKSLRAQYKHFMHTFKRYNKELGVLGAILSKETKRTCDFEDAEAGSASEPTAPASNPTSSLP